MTRPRRSSTCRRSARRSSLRPLRSPPGNLPMFFFFRAEDGIRALIVTGVQTCALPIFEGRVAIVTGAAHGIGRAICVELAREGARVWACDVRAPELAATRAAVDAVRPGAGQTAVVDVRDARAVADF